MGKRSNIKTTILQEIRREVINDAEIHFGHPYFNTATMAEINRMMLKKLACFYDVPFPIKKKVNREHQHHGGWSSVIDRNYSQERQDLVTMSE